eukprot:TRINITY_DN17546_c0_g1_i1.p1 TRINITY_DN17546_c0_g1~~TRINITY_DN17546_c0_g1_i1.p1  ORF type:complete len:253 (-),score=71.52 TRINITY_DN17546_c0_g1_i1:170-898(-)
MFAARRLAPITGRFMGRALARNAAAVPRRTLTTRTFTSNSWSIRSLAAPVGGVALAAGMVSFHCLAYEHTLDGEIGAHAAALPLEGVAGTRHERTFIAIKPDGVQRGLVSEVIKRFEARGYKLVAIKVVDVTEEHAREHYDDLKSKPFFPSLVKYFSSGPVVAMVWEGKGAISGGRKLVGATNPDDSLPGSIRGDLCIQVGRNIVHGSDSPDAAKHEINLWFKEEEVVSWEQETNKWIYEKV